MCAPARTCNATNCGKWRYKEKADTLGETHCKCGRPFTDIIYKPLPKGGNGRAGGAQAAPKAGAKAKPKPKGKAKATPAPWRKPQTGRTSSPTRPQSGNMGASRVHKVDAKKVKDPVYGWAFIEEVAKDFPVLSELGELAGRSKQQALKEKAGALPPAQRVEHLKKRLKEEKEELQRRCEAVESTEAEIDRLQSRLKQAVEGRDDQDDVVRQLGLELQNAEAQLPPTPGIKPVGRQLPQGDRGMEEALNQVKTLLEREAGGRLTTELCTDYLVHAEAFKNMFKEVREVNEAKLTQEAADRRMALREQKREYEGTGGDEADDWQERRSRCRRAGAASAAAQAARSETAPDKAPEGAMDVEATPSTTAHPAQGSDAPPATVQPSEGNLGPLATVPRGRTQDRDRTPRRAKTATGAPAETQAAGSHGQPSATVQQSATAEGSPKHRISITPAVSSSVSSLSPSPDRKGSKEGDATGATGSPTAQAVGETTAPGQPNEGGGASMYT